jgi:5-formyltetrahydrofolate cyclo-ligase
MPTPRLKGGFRKFDPARIPKDKYGEAANLSSSERWGEELPLEVLPRLDLIVTGAVAVTRGGRRCGKGHGYGDLEYAILRELGHPPVPIVTTVHPLQLLDDFPAGRYDIPLTLVATPDELIEIEDPPPPPSGIDWAQLPADALEAMPILEQLRALQTRDFCK